MKYTLLLLTIISCLFGCKEKSDEEIQLERKKEIADSIKAVCAIRGHYQDTSGARLADPNRKYLGYSSLIPASTETLIDDPDSSYVVQKIGQHYYRCGRCQTTWTTYDTTKYIRTLWRRQARTGQLRYEN